MKKEKYKDGKSFMCRMCKQRVFTNDPDKHRCKYCHRLICNDCKVTLKVCIDCFVKHNQDDITRDYHKDTHGITG